MNSRLAWWAGGLFLLFFVVAVLAQLSAAESRRVDALRLPHILRACEAAARAEDGSPLRLTLGTRGEWHVERQGDQVKWFLTGIFQKAGFDQVLYCEAVEAKGAFQVTGIESSAWYTPPPF